MLKVKISKNSEEVSNFYVELSLARGYSNDCICVDALQFLNLRILYGKSFHIRAIFVVNVFLVFKSGSSSMDINYL